MEVGEFLSPIRRPHPMTKEACGELGVIKTLRFMVLCIS
jgi:hypothetical protein